MYTDIEQVIEQLRDNKVSNFIVYEGKNNGDKYNNGILLDCTFDDETTEQKFDKLRKCIERQVENFYTIKSLDGNSKNCLLYLNTCKKSQPNPQQVASVGALPNLDGYISKNELNAILAQKESEFNARRTEEKLERLEKELKDAQASNGAVNDFFQKITPFVGPILSGFFKNRVPQVAQIGALNADAPELPQTEDEGEELDITDEDFKRICGALREWGSKDKDYINILCALPSFVENPMYETAKKFILNN